MASRDNTGKKDKNIQSLNILIFESTMSFLFSTKYSQDFTLKEIGTYKGYKHPFAPFTFYLINQEQISNLLNLFLQNQTKDNNKYKFNVILYKTDSISNCNLLFNQLSTIDNFLHPYVVILTDSNETKDNLLELFADKKFNRRTVTVINTNNKENEDTMTLLGKQLFNIFIYYNQLGDRLINFPNKEKTSQNVHAQRLNFLVCGRPGAGKSTFINEFFQEQMCLEGEQMSCTNKLTKYYHGKYLLRVYDTPRFEEKKNADEVIELIQSMFDEKNPQREDIKVIFYLINSKEKTILEMDKYFYKS